MKAKAEFRQAFSSPSLYYRVLYLISTQRLRLPVRRYILELFDVPLDATVVRKLTTYAKTLRESDMEANEPDDAKPKPRLRPRVSIFGRPTRAAASQSSSDESMEELSMDSSDEENQPRKPLAHERPVSLMPVRRVVGFEGQDLDEEKVKEKEREAQSSGRVPYAAQTSRRGGQNMNGVNRRRYKPDEEDADDEF